MLGLAVAAQGGETARQILDRQRALDDGERHWVDRHAQLQMDLLDGKGAKRQRALEVFDKRYPDREQRTMVYFSAPASVQGTAFFALTRPDRSADQWLSVPADKRARRIGAQARKRAFIGADFTYQDLDLLAAMPSWTEADAASSLNGEAIVDGVPCYVIDLQPKREDIGYARIVVWLGRDDLVARQLEFYEAAATWFGAGVASQPTRRIRQSDIRPVGTIPVPHHIEVESPGEGSKTIVTFTRVVFDQDLPEALFSQRAMEWRSYQPPPTGGTAAPDASDPAARKGARD